MNAAEKRLVAKLKRLGREDLALEVEDVLEEADLAEAYRELGTAILRQRRAGQPRRKLEKPVT